MIILVLEFTNLKFVSRVNLNFFQETVNIYTKIYVLLMNLKSMDVIWDTAINKCKQ